MAEKREFPTKSEIEAAVKSVLSKRNAERKLVIELSQKCYGYTAAELKDRSCESLNTRLKSLTGVVINEMLDAGTLLIDEDKLLSLPSPVEEKRRSRVRKKKGGAQKSGGARKRRSQISGHSARKTARRCGREVRGMQSQKDEQGKVFVRAQKAVTLAINQAGGEFSKNSA